MPEKLSPEQLKAAKDEHKRLVIKKQKLELARLEAEDMPITEEEFNQAQQFGFKG